MNTAVLDKPKETPYEPKSKEPLAAGGFGNKRPPNVKTKLGYASNEDEDNDPWGALGLEDPFK